ncbi:fimbrillin family protein [Odoribacter sp. OttesenSCG-928-J03]|nr:fimbrillin family protein [Odoribacter sp. OttesenSCG-928-J03]MDL2330615.1 fimbrillin family protein [Odoribacter sp. OttesenSCG-928-A06]
MYRKTIYILYAALLGMSCSKNGHDSLENNEIRMTAKIEESGLVTTKAQTKSETFDTQYHMYLPLNSFNESDQLIHSVNCDPTGILSADPTLYWDDIAPAPVRENTRFILSNITPAEFSTGTRKDIVWGKETGWLSTLQFKLYHKMSQLSFVLIDETIDEDIQFNNKTKVAITSGLCRDANGMNIETGEITINAGKREACTTIKLSESVAKDLSDPDSRSMGILRAGIVPPQNFSANTNIEITAGTYIYNIGLDQILFPDNTPITKLNPGEHLTIYITLTEHKISFEAQVNEWDEIQLDRNIEVTRVFHISNWNELSDLMLAINTGYTFKGMVVRLTDNIRIEDQISLGDEENPFEGIFDGNGKVITGLGSINAYNKGGLFGYTKGATLQNITIEEPYVTTGELKSLGALVDLAENTTLFNCRVQRATAGDSHRTGQINGTENNTGGLIGKALGKSSLNRCYVIADIRSSSDYVGGLVGHSAASINHCSAQGNINADASSYVGGLIGYAMYNVNDSYAWSTMYGNSKVGGLIGHSEGSVSNSYSDCSITAAASADIGGLLGSMGFYSKVNAGFWLYNPNYGGVGSAELDQTTCGFFNVAGMSAGIVDRLNGTPSSGIWKKSSDDKRAIFANE